MGIEQIIQSGDESITLGLVGLDCRGFSGALVDTKTNTRFLADLDTDRLVAPLQNQA